MTASEDRYVRIKKTKQQQSKNNNNNKKEQKAKNKKQKTKTKTKQNSYLLLSHNTTAVATFILFFKDLRL